MQQLLLLLELWEWLSRWSVEYPVLTSKLDMLVNDVRHGVLLLIVSMKTC